MGPHLIWHRLPVTHDNRQLGQKRRGAARRSEPGEPQVGENLLDGCARFKLGFRKPGPGRTVPGRQGNGLTEILNREFFPTVGRFRIEAGQTAGEPGPILSQCRIFGLPGQGFAVGPKRGFGILARYHSPLIDRIKGRTRRKNKPIGSNTGDGRDHQKTAYQETRSRKAPSEPTAAIALN